MDRLVTHRTGITIVVLLIFGLTAFATIAAGFGDPTTAAENANGVLSVIAPFVTLVLGFWFGTSQADKTQNDATETTKQATQLVAEVKASGDAAQTIAAAEASGKYARVL